MSLLRSIVYCSLSQNAQLKAKHISSINNTIVDALSRRQVYRFKKVAPDSGVILLCNTSSVLEYVVLEANKLIEASLSRNTRLTYENRIVHFKIIGDGICWYYTDLRQCII